MIAIVSSPFLLYPFSYPFFSSPHVMVEESEDDSENEMLQPEDSAIFELAKQGDREGMEQILEAKGALVNSR